MDVIQVDECVKLKRDIPELGLYCGEVGFVRSIWHSPDSVYEVEFQRKCPNFHMRALLRLSQIARDLKDQVLPLQGELR